MEICLKNRIVPTQIERFKAIVKVHSLIAEVRLILLSEYPSSMAIKGLKIADNCRINW